MHGSIDRSIHAEGIFYEPVNNQYIFRKQGRIFCVKSRGVR